MRIALHQITTRRASFAEDLKAYRDAGWSAFELHLDKVRAHVQAHGLDAWVRALKESGLRPVGATGHVVQAFAQEEALRKNEALFTDSLALMEAVGCPVLVFGGDGPDAPPQAPDNTEAGLAARDRAYRESLERFAEQIARLADQAAPRGITLALEMNWCRLCRSVATAAEVLDRVGRPNVGFLFDAAHFAVSPSRLEDLDRVRSRIVYGHLDDMRPCPPELTNVNNDRVIPGEGALPLRAWYEKVESCGYRGWHAVELFCEDLWALPAEKIARRVLEGCRKVWPEATF